jgi:hypothetical protein
MHARITGRARQGGRLDWHNLHAGRRFACAHGAGRENEERCRENERVAAYRVPALARPATARGRRSPPATQHTSTMGGHGDHHAAPAAQAPGEVRYGPRKLARSGPVAASRGCAPCRSHCANRAAGAAAACPLAIARRSVCSSRWLAVEGAHCGLTRRAESAIAVAAARRRRSRRGGNGAPPPAARRPLPPVAAPREPAGRSRLRWFPHSLPWLCGVSPRPSRRPGAHPPRVARRPASALSPARSPRRTWRTPRSSPRRAASGGGTTWCCCAWTRWRPRRTPVRAPTRRAERGAACGSWRLVSPQSARPHFANARLPLSPRSLLAHPPLQVPTRASATRAPSTASCASGTCCSSTASSPRPARSPRRRTCTRRRRCRRRRRTKARESSRGRGSLLPPPAAVAPGEAGGGRGDVPLGHTAAAAISMGGAAGQRAPRPGARRPLGR